MFAWSFHTWPWFLQQTFLFLIGARSMLNCCNEQIWWWVSLPRKQVWAWAWAFYHSSAYVPIKTYFCKLIMHTCLVQTIYKLFWYIKILFCVYVQVRPATDGVSSLRVLGILSFAEMRDELPRMLATEQLVQVLSMKKIHWISRESIIFTWRLKSDMNPTSGEIIFFQIMICAWKEKALQISPQNSILGAQIHMFASRFKFTWSFYLLAVSNFCWNMSIMQFG